MTTGHYFNGVQVSSEQYQTASRLQQQIYQAAELQAKTRERLETQLLELLRTGSPLWQAMWRSYAFPLREFSPDFMLEVMTWLMTSEQSTNAEGNPPEVNALLVLIQTLPPEVVTALKARLAALPPLPDAQQERVQQVLLRLDELDRLLKRAQSDGELADWQRLWPELVYQRLSVLGKTPSGNRLPAAGPVRAPFLRWLVSTDPTEMQPEGANPETFAHAWRTSLQEALPPLLNSPPDPSDRPFLLQYLIEQQATPLSGLAYGSAKGADRALAALVKEEADMQRLSALALAALRRTLLSDYLPSAELKWVDDMRTPELNPGEAWSDAFLARLDTLAPERRQPWPALVAFARTATAGKPSAKWLKEAQKYLDAVGAETFREVLAASLPLLSRVRTFPLRRTHYGADPNLTLDSFNSLSLKGLLWMVPLVTDAALTRLLSGVVESALKKVPGVGPREPKVANAAVYALGQIDSEMALSALARLNTTVTFKGTLKEVGKALDVVAKRLNVTPDELLEMGVPTLGMQAVGERVETLGDAEARLSVDALGAHLSFSKGGKALKSVPAAVKKDYAEELKELKAAQKEAEKAVSALAQRLDSLMIEPRVWQGKPWQERYLNHPLAGTVARRLIWLIGGVPAFYADGKMLNVNGQPVALNADSEVKLWHPIGREVAEVLTWRDRLETLEIRQPFKQAWREVYVLTDAERRTATYSNRFAGHILKQHQFHQLAALRGWRNRLRLMVDDSYPPTMRDLPAYGLRAEYWIEGIGENYGEDSTDSGSYLRVTTDQVRFYPLGAPENHAHASGGGYTMWVNQAQQPVAPLPLTEIPPLVLSEILRDVDLFVGVASVGNDPTWQDGGPGGRFRAYWQSYSFGELTETAKTRAEYLKRLIPRLKIKDRLSLDGRFLKVRGDRRTYKVHLGSGNILMEPNDQYLCIVPDRSGAVGKGNSLDVDFDGDRTLSLILSKAFLLADDTKITDPVILQQLRR